MDLAKAPFLKVAIIIIYSIQNGRRRTTLWILLPLNRYLFIYLFIYLHCADSAVTKAQGWGPRFINRNAIPISCHAAILWTSKENSLNVNSTVIGLMLLKLRRPLLGSELARKNPYRTFKARPKIEQSC